MYSKVIYADIFKPFLSRQYWSVVPWILSNLNFHRFMKRSLFCLSHFEHKCPLLCFFRNPLDLSRSFKQVSDGLRLRIDFTFILNFPCADLIRLDQASRAHELQKSITYPRCLKEGMKGLGMKGTYAFGIGLGHMVGVLALLPYRLCWIWPSESRAIKCWEHRGGLPNRNIQ